MASAGGTAGADRPGDARHNGSQRHEEQRCEPADDAPLLVEARLLGSMTLRLSMIAKMISMEMAPM